METFLYTPKKSKNADFTVWMGFPERYEFSLSSLGYLWLFKIIDEMDDINAERICTDTEKTIAQIPDMFSFSFSFDFDFLKIFEMLDKYNIPLKSAEREKPLVFAGGPVVTANPEPYKDLFDFFIIGDGEDVNKKVIEFCKNNKELPKNELLKEISEFEGVCVPYVSQKVVKSTKRLEQCIYTPIISDEAFFKNTFIIEMERGCANRCGFCLASYLNLPLRSVPKDELFNAIDFGLKYTNKIAFLGAEVSAHPQFEAVCDYIYNKNNEIATKSLHHSVVPLPLTREAVPPRIEMNFSSLRVDAIKENVIKTLVACGQKNITLAIEAGSERLRKVINKNITEEQIFNAVEIAHKNGLKGIKFYGMIGLPTETQEDIEEFVNLIKKIKNNHKGFEISCGFSSFVPKPHTPFQWIGREDTKSLEKKCQFLQKELRKIGVNVQLPSVKWDYWQAVLSRGGGEAARQLSSYAVQNSGKLKVESFSSHTPSPDGEGRDGVISIDNSLPSDPPTFQSSNSTPSPQPSPSEGGGSMQLLPYNFTDFLIDVYKQGGKLGAFKSSAKKYGIDTDYLAYGDFRCSPYYLTRHCTAHTSPTMTPSPTKKSCRRGENSFNGEGTCDDFGTELPWDFIEINPGKEFLAKECRRLISE